MNRIDKEAKEAIALVIFIAIIVIGYASWYGYQSDKAFAKYVATQLRDEVK